MTLSDDGNDGNDGIPDPVSEGSNLTLSKKELRASLTSVKGKMVREWCEENGDWGAQLLSEWDHDKNGKKITPDNVAAGGGGKMEMDLFEILGIEIDLGPPLSKLGGCFECGRVAAHEHHVVPRSKGGTKTVALCEKCHNLVHGLKFMDHARLTREALQRKRSRKERTGGIPFGFSVATDGVKLLPNDEERRVIDAAAWLRGEGLSYRQVCEQLDELEFRNRNEVPWHPAQVRRVLQKTRLYAPDAVRGGVLVAHSTDLIFALD